MFWSYYKVSNQYLLIFMLDLQSKLKVVFCKNEKSQHYGFVLCIKRGPGFITGQIFHAGEEGDYGA